MSNTMVVQGLISTPRLNDELKEAAAVQEVLLQHEAPKCQSLECKGMSIPAHYLGGDYYGFIYEEEKNKYWVFIGDVMGKGIPAFAKMAMLRTAICTLAPYSKNPAELLKKVNMALYEDLKMLRSFATLFCGLYDLNDHSFTYSSAGHPGPILKRLNQPCEQLNVKGVAIGFLYSRTFQEKKIPLEPEDYLFIFTDGILEAMNEQKIQFGLERIIEIINHHEHYPSLIPTITEKVVQFSNNKQRDDVTMVTMKRCAH